MVHLSTLTLLSATVIAVSADHVHSPRSHEAAHEIKKRALAYGVSEAAAAHDYEARLGKRQNPAVQIISSCSVPGQFGISFDDGMDSFNDQLQTLFDNNNAKTSFFVNGNNWDCLYNRENDMKRAFYDGHLLGSHTNHHLDLSTLTWDQLHDEFWQVETIFIKMFGAIPLHFRPPFGSYNDLVLAVAQNRGYTHMWLWTDDTGDSADNPPSAATIRAQYTSLGNRALSQAGPIVLNHETYSETANEVMPQVVPALRKKGWQLQALPICAGLNGSPYDWPSWYRWIQPPGTRDATWTCT